MHANEVTGAGRTTFGAGQASVDDEGSPLHAGDMRAELERTFVNVEAVLESVTPLLGTGVGVEVAPLSLTS